MGLRANTTLRVRVLTTPGKACLTLPESALFEDQDPPAVIVVENYKKTTVKDGDKEKAKLAQARANAIGQLVQATGQALQSIGK